jgi:hypothetical protein
MNITLHSLILFGVQIRAAFLKEAVPLSLLTSLRVNAALQSLQLHGM